MLNYKYLGENKLLIYTDVFDKFNDMVNVYVHYLCCW